MPSPKMHSELYNVISIMSLYVIFSISNTKDRSMVSPYLIHYLRGVSNGPASNLLLYKNNLYRYTKCKAIYEDEQIRKHLALSMTVLTSARYGAVESTYQWYTTWWYLNLPSTTLAENEKVHVIKLVVRWTCGNERVKKSDCVPKQIGFWWIEWRPLLSFLRSLHDLSKPGSV